MAQEHTMIFRRIMSPRGAPLSRAGSIISVLTSIWVVVYRFVVNPEFHDIHSRFTNSGLSDLYIPARRSNTRCCSKGAANGVR